MKKKPTPRPRPRPRPKDTPATRKRRLQQRLQEINDRNEKEMSALMKSIDKIKTRFRSKKASGSTK